MLLNFASDKPFVYKNGEFTFFDRKNLENDLPLFLKENIEKTIYVITGPGYFSSTRVGVEVINILISLGFLENVYFLDKIEFFSKLGFNDIYLFSGNKNKFINKDKIVFKKDLDINYKIEELFELEIENIEQILYKDILKEYKNITWNKLEEKQLLKPFYIFEPITC